MAQNKQLRELYAVRDSYYFQLNEIYAVAVSAKADTGLRLMFQVRHEQLRNIYDQIIKVHSDVVTRVANTTEQNLEIEHDFLRKCSFIPVNMSTRSNPSVKEVNARVDKLAEQFEKGLEAFKNQFLLTENSTVPLISGEQSKEDAKNGRPRSIAVEFSLRWHRDLVFYNKKMLKGSSVVVSEMLTADSLLLFKKSERNVWSPKKQASSSNLIQSDSESEYVKETELEVIIESPSGKFRVDSEVQATWIMKDASVQVDWR
ncbi:hypothetical protein NQ314_014136 [Rhamnusium bicolor]|uniref:Uncharacterized protein n=1 Tax=Rhamnusium bicolor TaxID=1586634 RepID=A0AAV8X3C1_9CUCU|nr:hypothetical protein NQ314_014136 [Rhamnusium bicolor]